ncbi:nucleoside deaminase [Paenibacillus flagellatus]|uniref:tRNA-specific adenosine deaminase n=1 Tax=Paenibacillus flagellatus TaxID=2211139 RepID=A0A2V5KND9_9BACL|nr:nucleoside deaminase [Paenibacillus flagellatus]PYI52577.1 tRNA-specific adenosine deaminase [Paenibacillus flagellatus]
MERQSEAFMQEAIAMACGNAQGVRGGPFGAVVVKDGRIVGRGVNEVTSANDPTAHAEVQAIRDACRHLGDFRLTDCDVYTSCEPCPMCLAALYWARVRTVYYGFDRDDASAAGFDDSLLYEEIPKPIGERRLKMVRLEPASADPNPFELWRESPHRTDY